MTNTVTVQVQAQDLRIDDELLIDGRTCVVIDEVEFPERGGAWVRLQIIPSQRYRVTWLDGKFSRRSDVDYVYRVTRQP